MSEPRVTRIHVEYDDGSFDDIGHLPQQDGHLPQQEPPFYSLGRKRPHSHKRDLGAHTSGAIAGILYVTAFYGRRHEYSVGDPDVSKLFEAFTK
jgi:hypothetical protein